MSSLLQFSGTTGPRGVNLEAYLVAPGPLMAKFGRTDDGKSTIFCEPIPSELVPCLQCGSSHPQLYTFWRKPRGAWGPWVIFQFNSEKHAPDLSVPLSLRHLPRDAKPVSPSENAQMWHR